MSSRVSIPIVSRLMGSAQTASTFTLAGWSSRSNDRGDATVKCHPPLMLLSYAFGICPLRSSPRPGSGLPCGRPPPRLPPKEPPCRSTPPSPLFRSEHRHPKTSMSPLRPRREDRPAPGRSREPPQAHSAIGSLRRMPTHAHAADSYARSLPPGHTPTGQGCLPRLVPCRGSASPVSCWFVHGYPPFRGFSPLAPHDPLGPCCPPCRLSRGTPAGACARRDMSREGLADEAIGASSPCGVAASRI